MDLYGKKDKSIPQKLIIISFELIMIFFAYWILFGESRDILNNWAGIKNQETDPIRKWLALGFCLIIFFRMGFTMLFLLKRKIPTEEAFSVPFAFALYYIGFSLFIITADEPVGAFDLPAVLFFVLGSWMNSYSEIQRNRWKKRHENKGKLYTEGLFRYSMHINYFGDVLWVLGFALLCRNGYALIIPLFLLSFFIFYNIPKLDAYLADKYGQSFKKYREQTKKLIPFVY